MQEPARCATKVRLALGPAIFVFLSAMPALSDDGRPADIHRKVASEESRIIKALSARDENALKRSVSALGKLIDAALERRSQGVAVTACDMSAHSLAFAAVSAAEGLAHRDEQRKILLADAQAASEDFRKDIQACEALIGRKAGSHAGVGKALRAL